MSTAHLLSGLFLLPSRCLSLVLLSLARPFLRPTYSPLLHLCRFALLADRNIYARTAVSSFLDDACPRVTLFNHVINPDEFGKCVFEIDIMNPRNKPRKHVETNLIR